MNAIVLHSERLKQTYSDPIGKVQLVIRSNYGRMMAYPSNSVAQLFAQITGTKTLSRHTLECIVALGYEIECVGAPGWQEVE